MDDRELGELIDETEYQARSRFHEYVTTEHLLFVLLTYPAVQKALEATDVRWVVIRDQLEYFFENKVPRVEIGKGQEVAQTLGFQRVLQRAILHAEYSSAETLNEEDILAALFTEPDSHAAYFLKQEGATRLSLLEYLSNQGHDKSWDHEELEDEEDLLGSRDETSLSDFVTDLSALAEQGELDPIIGREKEIERIIQILSRRNKNNPLLVGDQGVGKTTLAEGIALAGAQKLLPQNLSELRVFSADMGSLVAGTRYRGDFEERFKKVIKELSKYPTPLLFIDEIHTIVGAGSTSGGSMDAANLLKPLLTRGDLRCMGSTTFEEYKSSFAKDRALARRFLKVEIQEPSDEQTLAILRGLKSRFEEHHGVQYSEAALKSAVSLSSKYINERKLPDKAIDVIDEVGAAARIAAEKAAAKNNGEKAAESVHVGVRQVEKVVSLMAKIPEASVSSSEKDKLARLKPALSRVVFGQEEAISAIATAITRARAGLGRDHTPIGSFLFVGPTGVGKTEISKQISNILGIPFIRFDMSEYMEAHAVARLIGAPPGYVGYEKGGLLTDEVSKHPHSVLLLDEIEKAHSDIFNLLLQVMDNASLTDTNGKVADFRNVLLVMTSNVGSEKMLSQPLGFESVGGEISSGAIEKMFRPEFRNRLDMIVKFKALGTEVNERIVDKFLSEIEAKLSDKKITLSLSSKARSWIVERGYVPQYGARSLYRFIQKEIEDKLANEILFGKLAQGGSAHLELAGDALSFRIEAREVKANAVADEMA